MASFRVVKKTQNGFLLLESEDLRPIKSRLTLFLGKKQAAVVVDTIASVDHPLYLAEPMAAVGQGAVLESKR